MSRKPIIAGNWKMNKNPQEAQAFVEAIAGKLPAGDKIEAAIGLTEFFKSFIYNNIINRRSVFLDCHSIFISDIHTSPFCLFVF